MGFYKYLGKLWKKPLSTMKDEYKKQIRSWRKDNSIVRISKPTRIDKARMYGYKAKGGFVVNRIKIKRGGRKRVQVHSGRKPSKSGQNKYSNKKSLQLICEERIQRKHPNLVILGSYWVGEDGQFKYFEVVSVDPNHPRILNDEETNWVLNKNKKMNALRGLTSQGRKMRGLRK
ncbi:MAG: 50S ribosomal protein L15e [Nanoarchaeota archaeon]|nr:50S ribosomal protein L15e [Nanoarchaeota archaeon]